ncbi:hypothetical protein [Methylobacterium sp. J-090]|uniref:hypothetical protein n=1 Tax=Methylobacterium sp. J-090 TaxID=2836666 RepID=UPI001FBB1F2F|nr:hypothetical protein [Methylobacterium sp. J-090]MCJ2080310.1 hypothetical protein [Methylobacterium sp. J-090]
MTSSRHGTMALSRQFGPWVSDLDPAERRARLRALRAIARLLAGPRADPLVRLLAQAEGDDDVLMPAADALEPLDRRKILASYSRLGTRPRGRPFIHATPRPRGTCGVEVVLAGLRDPNIRFP